LPHNNIAALRDRAKLTQAQLAIATKTTQPYISRLEKGELVKPGKETLRQLSNALRVSAHEITFVRSPYKSWSRNEVIAWWKSNAAEVQAIVELMQEHQAILQYPDVSVMKSVLMVLQDVVDFELEEGVNGKP
jgi:transcriptional regulator with XRE-family HTH domain